MNTPPITDDMVRDLYKLAEDTRVGMRTSGGDYVSWQDVRDICNEAVGIFDSSYAQSLGPEWFAMRQRESRMLAADLLGELAPYGFGPPCTDHWHCDPKEAAHACDVDRSKPCPTCEESPAQPVITTITAANITDKQIRSLVDDGSGDQWINVHGVQRRLSYYIFDALHSHSDEIKARARGICADFLNARAPSANATATPDQTDAQKITAVVTWCRARLVDCERTIEHRESYTHSIVREHAFGERAAIDAVLRILDAPETAKPMLEFKVYEVLAANGVERASFIAARVVEALVGSAKGAGR